MKIGIISSIMDGWSYEEMIDEISRLGYDSVEVACWPQGKSERRYGGVSHIDTENMTKEYKDHILSYARDHKIEISSLAYYPNTMDSDIEKRERNIKHLYSVIDASHFLGVDLVTTFIGRDQYKTIEDNLILAKEIWTPILSYAKERNVRIAIENCPMLFGPDQWPGGQNIFTSPAKWRKVFEILPFDNLGINFDPSHFVWQRMDYVKAIYDFGDKIFHVHFKDIKIREDLLAQCGVMAYPLDYMIPKIPGLGDVNWSKFISALTDVGYKGYTAIELEDRAFEDSRERIVDSMVLAHRYLKQFIN